MVKVYYSLYDRLLSVKSLDKAFEKVRAAKGAAGVDGQSIESFDQERAEHLAQLVNELKEKSYRPQPVRRVFIPKDDGGERALGIPTVRDRVIQQALLDIMQPIFEPSFHPSSYAYRKGMGCHQAIAKATLFIRKYGFRWVVDMDLSKCFDMLNHDLIVKSVRERITDGSIIKLIKMFLESGVMNQGDLEESVQGSPQGGVISPLLANIYLDAFDQEMKRRRYRIVRYADDIVIFSRSKKAAENALKVASKILEGDLKLKVNRKKTKILNAKEGIPYLGVVVSTGYISIQEKKVKRFKEAVKRITGRNVGRSFSEVVKRLNWLTRGFANYFRIADCKGVLKDLMAWIRRRLRMVQMSLWKKPAKLHRRLRQLGYKGPFDSIRMRSWKNSASPLANYALPSKALLKAGMFDMTTVKIGEPVSVFLK